MKKYQVKKVNYLEIKHELVPEHYRGNPKFLNYINIKGTVVALYENTSKPDIEFYKLNKYMGIFFKDDKYLVTGFNEVPNKVEAVLCKKCNTVLYSAYRHDYHGCSCENETTVDGGTDYLKSSAVSFDCVEVGTLNLLTDRFTKARKKNVEKSKQKSLRKRTSKGKNKKTGIRKSTTKKRSKSTLKA